MEIGKKSPCVAEGVQQRYPQGLEVKGDDMIIISGAELVKMFVFMKNPIKLGDSY